MDFDELTDIIRRNGPAWAAERIQHEESALTAARARIEDPLASRAMDDEQFRQDRARIADLEAKLAKREAQLVWAFEKCAVSRRHFHLHRIEWLEVPKPSGFRAMQFDGTPAGLLAAIDAATEGV